MADKHIPISGEMYLVPTNPYVPPVVSYERKGYADQIEETKNTDSGVVAANTSTKEVMTVSWISRLITVVRHPLTWRLMKSIDEGYELVIEMKEALKDRKLTSGEVELLVDKMEDLLKSLLGTED